MRIAHIMLSGGRGGIQSAFHAYTHALTALGHQVTCIVAPDTDCGAYVTHKIPLFSQYDPRAIYQVRQHVKQCDLIISHGKRGGTIAHFANFLLHKPHVHVLHRYRFKHLARFDQVVCVTSDLQVHLPEHINSVHVPLWLPALPKQTAPHAIFTPPVIGFLGRFVPEKGADRLITAVRRMQNNGFACRAIIGGDGALRADLEKQANGLPITFAGWVHDIDAFFAQIDVLCVPSRMESFGLIILEAMARGVPVVASNAPGPSEIITHGVDGLVCAHADEMVENLQLVLTDNNLHARLIAGGLQTVQHYTETAVLPRLKQAIESALPINE